MRASGSPDQTEGPLFLHGAWSACIRACSTTTTMVVWWYPLAGRKLTHGYPRALLTNHGEKQTFPRRFRASNHAPGTKLDSVLRSTTRKLYRRLFSQCTRRKKKKPLEYTPITIITSEVSITVQRGDCTCERRSLELRAP